MSVHYCSGHQLKIYNSSFCRSNQNERLLLALTSNNNSFLYRIPIWDGQYYLVAFFRVAISKKKGCKNCSLSVLNNNISFWYKHHVL